MLNPDAYLSHKIFSHNPDEEALRDGYGKGLLRAARNEAVVVLTADLADSTRVEWFRKVYPARFIEIGVAEQNMAAIAAGLAVSGKIPFINSYATFSPGRNWEQIRTTIAYNNANVKIAGHHAGVSTGPDGATHQATEDIALMRSLPNMKVIVPCDAIEARKATVAAAHLLGPVYIRLEREKTPLMTTEDTMFTPGKAYVLWHTGRKNVDIAIIGAGPLLYHALLAARELEKHKIGAVVINLHTIKPLDERSVVAWAQKTGAIVTVEEHTVMGGVGSAIAEVTAQHAPVPMEFVGVQDVFGQSGRLHELWKRYHLDVRDIMQAAQRAVKRK